MKHALNAPIVKFIYAYTQTETASRDTTLLLNTGGDNGRHWEHLMGRKCREGKERKCSK